MRCLVIQTAFLGDVILTVPLLNLLRSSDRVSWLGIVAAPPGSELLEEQRIADRVIVYDKRGKDAGTAGLARLVREIQGESVDVALVPHRSFRSALVPLLARVPVRVGFETSGGRALLTHRVPYGTGTHEVERVAGLAARAGVEVPDGRVPFRLAATEEEREALGAELADLALPADAPLVVVAPGSRWATKRWPPRRFAAAADALSRELSAIAVIVGSEDDRDAAAETVDRMETPAHDLAGRQSVARLTALMERATVVLSNDSAAAHIAAGVGTPVVAVFGPTVPAQGFAPYGEHARVVEAELPCRPCGKHGSEKCPLGTLECMERVASETVVAQALDLLGEGATGA